MAGVIKGGVLRAYKGTTPIGHATSCTLSIQADSVEIDTKDISLYPEYKATKIKGTLTVDGFFSYDTANVRPISLLNSMLNKESLTLKVETGVAGTQSISFSGIVLGFDVDATINSISTFSVAFQISGTITVSDLLVDTTVIGDSTGTVIGDSSGVIIGW